MSESKSIDFLVIAALEEERDAMLDLLGEYEKLDKEGDIYTTYLSSVKSNRKDKSIFSVAVVCPLNMGPINAATLANSATRKWNPQFVILMGIALGVEGEVNHGDVMISTQIADYTLGKVKNGERAIRWEVFPSGPSLIDSANNLKKDWSDSIPKKHPANKTCSKFKGVIASGGDVISDDQVISSYSKNWPKLIGIEMESGGVASGVYQTPSRPEFIMIKSVSDFGKDKHDPEVLPFRAYASYSSATFVLELIKSGPATSITKSVSIKADKENKNEELKRAERRWAYIQNHEIQKFEFKFLLKNEVGKDWLLGAFKDIRVFISRDKKGLSLQDILSLSEKPNTIKSLRKLEKPISSFWQLYEKETGFWCKRIKPLSEIPELVAGFDCEFPFSLLEENKLTLQNLAEHDDIGVSFPPSVFQAGIEEIMFTISGDSFHFPIYISDEKSLDMYHTMAATFQGISQKQSDPINFAFGYQGFQLLEMFHEQTLPRKEDEKKFEKRSPLGAQSGPNGISISFYPSIPKSFNKSEESKEYSFTFQNNFINYSKIEKELRSKIESESYERQDFLNLCSLLSVQHRFSELLEMVKTEENLNGELPNDMYGFRGSPPLARASRSCPSLQPDINTVLNGQKPLLSVVPTTLGY